MSYNRTVWVNDSLPAINAENLNKIENGIEKSYILKNLYSNNYMVLANLTYSNGTYTQKTADTSTDISWKIQAFNNDSYVKILNTLTSNELSRKSMNFTKDNTFNNINFGLNGSSKDSVIKINISDLEDGKTYTISWNLLNNVQGSIAWNEIQIEEGNNATSYSNFVGVIVESGSNDNGSWIKYSDGTMVCHRTFSITLDCRQQWGNLYVAIDDNIINFPQEFIETPFVIRDLLTSSSASCWLINYSMPYITTKIYKNFSIARATSSDSVPIQLNLLAIGRWK